MALRPKPSVSSRQYASIVADRGAKKAEADAMGVVPAMVSRWANHLVKPSTANRISIKERHPVVELLGWDVDAPDERFQGAA
jgi:hypothetical protein